MAGQATFKGDRARAYASMEADLNLDEEFALDSGSRVNLCSPSAARRYFMNKRAANLKIVGVAGSQSATSAGDLKLTVVDERIDDAYRGRRDIKRGFLSRVIDNFFCVRTLLPLGSNWRYLWRVTLNGSPCLRVLFTSFDLWRVA